ncbi:MAG: hypothetical protein JWP59_287, partial [Massilia sp.]|nr:hypothetical protein [Massilia sp.]
MMVSMSAAGAAAVCLPAFADQPAASPNMAIAAAAAAATGAELYLEVTVNGEPSGQLLAARQGPRGLTVSRADLRQLGLNRGALAPGVAGEAVEASDDLAPDAIAGLTYRYDPASQSLALTVADSLRTPFAISARSTVRPPRAGATPGTVINYNGLVQSARTGGRSAAIAALEARVFNERGVFSTSGLASSIGADSGRHQRFIRHDSFWSESDSDTLRTLRLGDSITSSLAWNRALRIGGVQWGKNLALRPDLATFPMPSIGGSAAVPSALSLYVNGVQQYSSDVPGGPFVLNQVGGINGAGEATVVTRDAFGRATTLSLPLYVDARMLAAGLFDYSVEAGVPRGGFGVSSFGYRGSPVAAASSRYGWSDALTLEAHGELAPRLLNAGAGALFALGRYGVVSANLAASAGAGTGLQAGLGYQYVARRFSFDVQSQRAQRGYADLSSRDGSPAPRASDRAALALALGDSSSMNASYAAYRAGIYVNQPANDAALSAAERQAIGGGGQGARIVSLGFSRSFRGGVFASLAAFNNLDQRASRGVFLSVSMALGERAAGSVVAGRQNGVAQLSMSAAGAPDLAGGAGWAVQEARLGDARLRSMQGQYLGRYGQLAVTAQSNGSGNGNTVALEGTGAVVLMDGVVAATRNVGAGFALVSTGGVANVPVLHENRLIGVTDAGGHLLVPTLNANVGNMLAIDTTDLAADRRVPVTIQAVNPRSLSGMLVRFPIETYEAANIILVDADGMPLPVGVNLTHRESGKRAMVGFEGLAFIDDLAS